MPLWVHKKVVVADYGFFNAKFKMQNAEFEKA